MFLKKAKCNENLKMKVRKQIMKTYHMKKIKYYITNYASLNFTALNGHFEIQSSSLVLAPKL